jgi:hypothetical protein
VIAAMTAPVVFQPSNPMAGLNEIGLPVIHAAWPFMYHNSPRVIIFTMLYPSANVI